MWFRFLVLIACIWIWQPLIAQYIHLNENPEETPFVPTGRPRMAAEWEPALGALISWPPSLPKQLILDLAKDTRIYVLVEDRATEKEAVQVFTKWGLMPNNVRFVPAPQGVDVSWTRDWGPHAVFGSDGIMKLADGKYIYATPVTGLACDDTLQFIYYDENNQVERTSIDDRIPDFISQATGYEGMYLPFAFTGGNVFTDGQRHGFSSCVLTNENRYAGVPDDKFFRDVHQLLGLENYNIISNFELDGIQHIDCYLKLLDEERIMVMRPPADHPLFDQYEGIIRNELQYLKNAYGRPYQILRLDTDRFRQDELAAYSNSLILNKVIYVPLFGIPQDKIAMQQWQDAMPGYIVKGFEFNMNEEKTLSENCRKHYKGIGWNGGDALHCRTRAIWDPDMVYISVDRLPETVKVDKGYTIRAIIKDYSVDGLIEDSLRVMWRIAGAKEWKSIPLTKDILMDHYIASIQGDLINRTVEYYVIAASHSGRKETMPRTAPEGHYTFRVDGNIK